MAPRGGGRNAPYPRPAMPAHYEYVLTAYGAWIAAFALYFVHLLRKSRRIRRALNNLPGAKGAS